MCYAPVVHEPFRIALGPWRLTGFGIALACAMFLAHAVLRRELWAVGLAPRTATRLFVWLGLGFVAGAKLSAIWIAGDLGPARTLAGGAYWSALAGAMGAAGWWAQRNRVPAGLTADALALAIAAAYPVGRTGCWAVGDDYGRPGGGILAVAFPRGAPPSTAGILERRFGIAPPPGAGPDTVLAVHPTQLYEVALGVAIFLVIWRYRARGAPPGAVGALYAVLAGSERFAVDFLRAKDDHIVGVLTVTQLGAVALVVVGLVAWQRLGRARTDLITTD